MRINPAMKAKIEELCWRRLTAECVYTPADLPTAIAHIGWLTTVKDPLIKSRAVKWWKFHDFQFRKDCGLEMPPFGCDRRVFHARRVNLKHGRYAKLPLPHDWAPDQGQALDGRTVPRPPAAGGAGRTARARPLV